MLLGALTGVITAGDVLSVGITGEIAAMYYYVPGVPTAYKGSSLST